MAAEAEVWIALNLSSFFFFSLAVVAIQTVAAETHLEIPAAVTAVADANLR